MVSSTCITAVIRLHTCRQWTVYSLVKLPESYWEANKYNPRISTRGALDEISFFYWIPHSLAFSRTCTHWGLQSQHIWFATYYPITKQSFKCKLLTKPILKDLWLQAYWSLCAVIYDDVFFKGSPQARLLQHRLRDTGSNLYLHLLKCNLHFWWCASMSIFIAVWSPLIST